MRHGLFRCLSAILLMSGQGAYPRYICVSLRQRNSFGSLAEGICVIYEGEIVERGTHEALLAKGGYYKRLNDMQSL